MSKIKIAFIKFGGLAAGGTEKALQTLAANLPKDKFDVTYFHCKAAPYIGSDFKHPDLDPHRLEYMKEKGIKLVEFKVKYKDVTKPTHDWVDTDFWDKFNEKDFDIIQTGRAGHSEYPFTKINVTPQVDLVTLPGMAEKKPNVAKVVHISNFQAETWLRAGGEAHKATVVPLFDELPELTDENLREELGLKEDCFVFGLHQRVDDGIYSPVALTAYKHLEDRHDNVAFVLLGGSEKYSQQATQLGLKNFHALPHTGDKLRLARFLETVDVYAHARADGETFSLAIAEAMYHSKPVVSHVAPAMGHKETMGDGGIVAQTIEEYIGFMEKMLTDKDAYKSMSEKAKTRFETTLSLESNINKWTEIYEEVYQENQTYTADDDWLNDWVDSE